MNGEETGISKYEGRDIHGLEMSHNDLMGFQIFGVDRTVPTLAHPINLRSIWIGHFAFFDLCYDICRCREDGERAE